MCTCRVLLWQGRHPAVRGPNLVRALETDVYRGDARRMLAVLVKLVAQIDANELMDFKVSARECG